MRAHTHIYICNRNKILFQNYTEARQLPSVLIITIKGLGFAGLDGTCFLIPTHRTSSLAMLFWKRGRTEMYGLEHSNVAGPPNRGELVTLR